MTQVFNLQTFGRIRDRDSATVFSDLDFHKCRFDDARVSMTSSPATRSTFRRIRFYDCSQTNCAIGPAIIDDVLIEGIDGRGLLIANACAYRHVILRGRVGDIKICRRIPSVSGPAGMLLHRQQKFDKANDEFYLDVDWALDISRAEFTSGEVEGIPVHLVRRDRSTQIVVRFSAIRTGRWRQVDLSGTYWAALLSAYEKKETGDVILAAPKAAPDFEALLTGLVRLRDAGIAEQD
jgi:hypothetical protein